MGRIAEIRKRLEAVSKDIQTFKAVTLDAECPVCDNCPMCESDREVEMTTFDYDAYAAGIQVFGIGEDLHAFEEFVKHAREDMQFLLDAFKTDDSTLEKSPCEGVDHES